MLEVVGIELDEPLLCAWRERVERARRHLGWNRPPLAIPVPREIVARRHASGASLAIAAPFDQLFTATEVNEWALCASLRERDPGHWSGLPDAMLVALREIAADRDRVIAPVLEDDLALARLERLAAAEHRPDIRELLDAAESRGVRHVLDERELTLGAGAGGRTWPLHALPRVEQVPWPALHEIPVAAVTGGNGRSSTVRLIAACARAHGWRDGCNCTEGVYIAREQAEPGGGDAAGARRVLRDPRVGAAVLETAHGEILRRGLAIDHATAAVVTSVSVGQFDECGVDDLDDLADVKLTVAQLVARDGLLVLNADDGPLRNKARGLDRRLGWRPPLAWFAADFDADVLASHRADLGSTCGARQGRLRLSHAGEEHDLGPLDAMPVTAGSAVTHNVASLAAAALAAVAFGIEPSTIAAEFGRLGSHSADRPDA